jgi:hypothetical protein
MSSSLVGRIIGGEHTDRRTAHVEAIGFVMPILPGRTEADRAAMASCAHCDRKEAYEDARRRAGITREAVFIQKGQGGDVAVVYLEGDDLTKAMEIVATSDEPFDRWFRDQVRDAHGVSLEDGFPPPEMALDFRVEIPA